MFSEIAIQVENLSKCFQIYDRPRDRLLQMLAGQRKQYYREFWALRDVSFQIRKGETVGIIGRNGSGKSTLLQMICGTLNPTQGSLRTQGRIAALLELGSGFNPEFTGRENVYLNASVLGLSNNEITARFENIAAFADIGDFMDQPVKAYSSGMMVRLAFAVMAHVDADILVVDEALAVGDAFFTQKCMRFLRRFQDQGGTLLFVSHDTGAIVNLCSQAILLNQGRMVRYGQPKAVAEEYLETLYQSRQAMDGALDVSHETKGQPGAETEIYRDMREDMINGSNLRNDIQVFQFSADQTGFGTGGAKIMSVQIQDATGAPLSWLVGGEAIILSIRSVALSDIERPIVGFEVKDRLGQVVFCDNTYLALREQNRAVREGQTLLTRFEFRLPRLPTGDYTISAAIADGTQDDHVQLHWLHEALAIKVHASSVVMGLIGLNIQHISMETQ